MRKKLIIVGAGGLGRIVHDVFFKDPNLNEEIELAGFLDTRADLVLPQDMNCPLLGSPRTYPIRRDEIFIPAIGDPKLRKNLVSPLEDQGAEFYSYKNGAFISARFKIGCGSFVTPGSVISVDCQFGNFNFIDTYCVIGHDVKIGDHCMIGAMTFIAGGVRIGNEVAIHPRATIAKAVEIGDGATIGIGSVVVKNVPAGVTVFGNPARVIY